MAQQFERRLINEYAQEKLDNVHWQTRVRLGPTKPGQESRMYLVKDRWADVVVFHPTRIEIIEVKLEPDPKAIGQLQLYEQLFKKTLRFQRYWDLAIQKVLLTTRIDDHVKEVCDDQNIEYRMYRPDWINYWEKRRFRL